MNIQNIRFRYSAAFCIVAAIMIFTGVISMSLINMLKHYSVEFSQKFNPAISAVINADRDLYQARTAELSLLLGTLDFDKAKNDYEENAQQAYDRMNRNLELLKAYPAIAEKLSGFETAYSDWKSKSDQVFLLVQQGKLEQAKVISNGESQTTFSQLRDYYDIAGETADEIGIYLGEQTLEAVETRLIQVWSFLIATVLITLGLGFYAPTSLSNALLKLADELKGLNSGDGNLTRRINSSRKDEIGSVSKEFDELLDGLTELIRTIVSQSNTVLDNVVSMRSGANGVQTSSKEQLSAIEVIVSSVNEMSIAIKEVARNTQLTASEIEEVTHLCGKGKQITVSAVDQIQEVSNTVGHASKAMEQLSESSDNIASVLDVIRGIAEQTNLLALNAAIEAARAGEQGRGFAVVADEVRSLASKTQQSTDDIQVMIEALQKGVKEAVQAIKTGLGSVSSSVTKTESTLEALDSIIDVAQRVSDASIQIATSTEEQSQVAEEVNSNLAKLSELGSTSHDHASENHERALLVADATQKLNASVTHFKLDKS